MSDANALPRGRPVGLPTDSQSPFLRAVPGCIAGAGIVERDQARDVNGIAATLAARLVRGPASLIPKDAP